MKHIILTLLIALLPIHLPSTDNYAGRLYIDPVSINVALYRSHSQDTVDRDDSAAYFFWGPAHQIIADHNTEAFAALGTVEVGMRARIAKDDGTIDYYRCTDVFKGHNTGTRITDWDGNSVMELADLLMYTCFDGRENVWVT